MPRLFVAATRHRYVLPAVSPVTVMGLFERVLLPDAPPSDEVHVAVKLVIGAPLPDGALNFTFSDPDAGRETVGMGGAPGAPTLMPPEVAVALVPTAWRAATRNLYAAPLVSPAMTWVVFVELNTRAAWAEPFLTGVTMYPVIAEPPSLAGGFHVTVADALPGTA